MTHDLDSDEAAAIGLLPGPLQYAYGITRDLTSPTDFEGAKIAFSPGEVAERPSVRWAPSRRRRSSTVLRWTESTGLSATFLPSPGTAITRSRGSIAIDSPLWTRPYVVIANADVLAACLPRQRKAVQGAAADAIDGVLAAQRGADKEAMSILLHVGERALRERR